MEQEKQFDLSTMDLEGITYASALMRKSHQWSAEITQVCETDTLTAEEKLAKIAMLASRASLWSVSRLSQHSDAIDAQLKAMSEAMFNYTESMRDFITEI